MTISGPAFCLGDNIDTDQIIPAIHLSHALGDPEERKVYGRAALSGLPKGASSVPFVNPGEDGTRYPIILAGENFGCGSSREHAPAALEIAGVKAIVARSFARIFYRNVIAGARFIPLTAPDLDVTAFSSGDHVELDVTTGHLICAAKGIEVACDPLGDAGDIIAAGGIFAYGRQLFSQDRSP